MSRNQLTRILYIHKSNDPTLSDAILAELCSLNYHIEAVSSLEALALQLMQSTFALVVCWVGGEQLYKLDTLLHRSKPMPPTLVLANLGCENRISDALNSGAGDYLLIDHQGRYRALMPSVIRNIMRRDRLEREKRDMLSALQYRNRALTSLNRIGNELTSILEPRQVTTRLMRSGIDILGAEGCSLWLWTDLSETDLICDAVIHRTSSPPLTGLEISKDRGIVGWVASNNRSTYINTTETDTRFAQSVDNQINFTTLSLLAVPLKVRDKVTGVLEFVNKLDGEFDDDDLSLAETLASYASTALENARLVESLRLSTADLQERNAELDAFGHTVAHDVQNMLARIVGFGQHLLDETERSEGSLSKETVLHPASVIVRDGAKMSKVIDALLLLSAVRDAEVNFEWLDMKGIVSEALERVSDSVQFKAAEFKVADKWPLTLGYAPWVEEIWFNYISNGLKYGGDPPRLHLGCDQICSPGMARFWILDSGPGISPSHQQNLFRPFTDYARRQKSGHGLGLSIVRRIVGKMNGTVGVESLEGEGSRFFFTLPIVQ